PGLKSKGHLLSVTQDSQFPLTSSPCTRNGSGGFEIGNIDLDAKGLRRPCRRHFEVYIADALHSFVRILIYKQLVLNDGSLFLLLFHQTDQRLFDSVVHQFAREYLARDFAQICPDSTLEVTENTVGGKKFVHTVRIFCQRTAAVETQVVVRIT